MINNNQFYIKDLKSVVFMGHSSAFAELIKINNSLNLDTIIITTTHQSKLLDKKLNFKIFDIINEKFKDFVDKKVTIENTIFISLGARYIFKKDIIDNFFLNNLVNFHDTRLPLDSGGGTLSWKIMREDRIDNQLVHLIDEGIDTGPIIANDLSLFPKECQIPKDFENYGLKKFIEFYSKFLKEINKGKFFNLKPQINYLGRYNPRLNTEIDGLINWELDSYDLYNFINAFDEPYKGASTFLNNRNFGKLYIKKVHLHGGDSSNHPYMSGIVSRHDKHWIVVSTKSKHSLLIEEVLDEDGKNLIKDIKVGDRFYTPYQELEKSKTTRTIVNSKGFKN
jgi:methionyl-tRNA formyltransferase